MQRKLSLIAIALVLATGVATTYSSFAERTVPAMAASMGPNGQGRSYDVTITNATRGQQLTPILVVTHRKGVNLFEVGSPASAELITLAETGNPGPLMALLGTMTGVVGDINVSAGLLNPGMSVTVEVDGSGPYRYVSAVAMLIPTNDAFFALNGVRLPGRSGASYSAVAYDAGSEVNDESCASIPGPDFVECGGPGMGGAPGGGEGYVHVHAGIHGIGDMNAAERDWRNPVVRVRVDRTSDMGDGDDDDDS